MKKRKSTPPPFTPPIIFGADGNNIPPIPPGALPPIPPDALPPIPPSEEQEARRLIYQDLLRRNLLELPPLPPAEGLPMPPPAALPMPPINEIPPMPPGTTPPMPRPPMPPPSMPTPPMPPPPAPNQQIPVIPVGMPQALPAPMNQAPAMPQRRRRPAATFDDAMARQMYDNLMAQQLGMRMAQQQQPFAAIPMPNAQAAQNFAALAPGQPIQQSPANIPPPIQAQPMGSLARQGAVGFGGGRQKIAQGQGFGYMPQQAIPPVGY